MEGATQVLRVWLRGYTIRACAPDDGMKAIAEAGSTPLFQNAMPSDRYLRFPDLLTYLSSSSPVGRKTNTMFRHKILSLAEAP